MKKVFISHSSIDALFVEELIELLECVGLNNSQIFCTSFEGYGIPLGADFLETLKKELNEDVLVLFMLSENFYKSPICLCEMGATWVKTNAHIPILIPPLGYSDVKGVIPNSQGLKITEMTKLVSLKGQIESWFSITPVNLAVWERKRNKFEASITELISKRNIEKEKMGKEGRSGKYNIL